MKKILVVDHDFDILDVVELILSDNGFHVRTNSNGYNLPDIVKEYTPDLILLDVRLPGKQGTELCKELKRIYSIPIILFSAEHKISFKECDADAFVQKPFEVKHLLDMVNLHLMLSTN
ncbi:MAG: response regulator [Ginsengibacter sp.]